jgi:hypothetical protein
MAKDPTQPTTVVPVEGPANRRRFLQALGAATVYVPPALVALLGDARAARAQSTAPSQSSAGENSGGGSDQTPQVRANAGEDETVVIGTPVTLDGSRSTSTLGLAISYAWAFDSKPATSTASLSGATTATPTFVADKTGSYVVRLTVTAGGVSDHATVTISTFNSAPIANAGPAQTIAAGALVKLDGSQSYDPNGQALTYSWFLAAPAGSLALLSGATSPNPTFTADLSGTYTATLIVNDGYVDSDAAFVLISTDNSAPVANAGFDQSAPLGSTVALDGTASSDVDGDALTYTWSILSAPPLSGATLSDAHSPMPSFTPDLLGMYIFGLIVHDGLVPSTQDTAQVYVFDAAAMVADVQHLQQEIAALDSGLFKNKSAQNSLVNKLNAVVQRVSKGKYADAVAQLRNVVLPKVTGGWITDPATEAALVLEIESLITTLEALI